jgi:hypothetical protein
VRQKIIRQGWPPRLLSNGKGLSTDNMPCDFLGATTVHWYDAHASDGRLRLAGTMIIRHRPGHGHSAHANRAAAATSTKSGRRVSVFTKRYAVVSLSMLLLGALCVAAEGPAMLVRKAAETFDEVAWSPEADSRAAGATRLSTEVAPPQPRSRASAAAHCRRMRSSITM